MATEKPRFTITLDEELQRKINFYQHTNHHKSQTQAVIDLIGKGLIREHSQNGPIPVLSAEELTLLNSWRKSHPSVKSKIRVLLSQPIISPDVPDEPKGYSPIALLSLFEEADVHIKNEVISILVDHANDKLMNASPFEAASEQLRAELEAEPISGSLDTAAK